MFLVFCSQPNWMFIQSYGCTIFSRISHSKLLLFIHSFKVFLKRLFKLTTTQRHYRHSTDSQILCQSFTPKHHRQLWVKDLPKVPNMAATHYCYYSYYYRHYYRGVLQMDQSKHYRSSTTLVYYLMRTPWCWCIRGFHLRPLIRPDVVVE